MRRCAFYMRSVSLMMLANFRSWLTDVYYFLMRFKMKKLFASVAVLAVVAPLAASAADFNGFFAGVGLGVNGFNTSYTVEGTNAKGDMGKTLFDGSLLAGYNKLFGQFLVGGEVSLGLSAGRPEITNTTGSKFRYTPGWYVRPAVRLGFLAAPKTLAFVSLGATSKKFEAKIVNDNAKKSKNVWGFSAGAGLETFVSDKVSLRGEYIWTRYANTKFTLDGTGYKFKSTDNLFRLSVAYNF